jgi:prepilin-type N-terminal cleavage/methylation domain-containing protein
MKNRRNSGFTLVEVIITMGLIGILALVSAQMYLNQVRQQRATSIRNNLDQLRTTVQNVARDPDAIRISAEKMVPMQALPADTVLPGGLMMPGGGSGGPGMQQGVPIGPGGMQSGALEHPETPVRFAQVGGAVPMTRANPMLYACVNHSGMNDPARDCREVTATQPAMPVRLFTRTGVEVNGAYSPDGVRCGPTTSALCPFKVSAKLYPKCPDNPALTTADHRCSRAQKVQIAWSLEQVQYGSGAVVPGFAPIKKITAEIENSASGIYAVPVSTQNIVATENLQVDCPKMTLTAAMLRAQGAPTPAGTPDGLLDRKYLPLVGMEFPQQVNQVDTYGQQVCGPDIGALDAELLKREVCLFQITQAWNGAVDPTGDVQNTSPTCNIKVIKRFKLKGSSRWTSDCQNEAGFLEFVDESGNSVPNYRLRKGGIVQDYYGTTLTPQQVADLKAQYNLGEDDGSDKFFCKFSGGACPAPFQHFQGWSATSGASRPILTRYVKWNVGDGCHYGWSDNDCGANACPGTTERDGTLCQSGSHGWANNGNIESSVCWNKQRNNPTNTCFSVGGACNCATPVTSGYDSNWRVEVSATRVQIGCH